MFADYHLHSSFSDDSQTPMEDIVKRAIALGLDEICFTEHVDYGVKTVLNCDYDAYFAALAAMREKYGKQIAIRAGIEFGIQLGTIEEFNSAFASYDFDFVILSCHQIDNQEFWRYEFQKGKNQREYQTAYYNAIYDVMRRYKSYSIVGHLDMIKRYDPCGDYPDDRIIPLAEKIMRLAIHDGKGIEVNTSTFRYGLPGTSPSRRLLELYHDLGGKIITIGSDSHDAGHVADHIPEVRKMLKSIGFQEICTFEHMKPVFHKL